MSPIKSWWTWCTESFGHMFAGVTAPILMVSAVVVLLVMGGGADDGASPNPPRSDVAGVCVEATPSANGISVCATNGTTTTAVAVTTPTPPPPTATPAPRTYTVKSGDTLSRICANEAPDMALDACVGAIVDLSELGGPDEIAEGQSLKLPPNASGGSGSTASANRTPTPGAGAAAENAADSEPTEEPTVEPTPQASLVALGPADSSDEEAVDDEAVREDATDEDATDDEAVEDDTSEDESVEDEATEEEADDSTPTEEELAAVEGTEYTVQDGDSLLGICFAEVPDMPEGECMQFIVLLNDLDGPDSIMEGQELILP